MKKAVFIITIAFGLATVGFGQEKTPRVGEPTGDGTTPTQVKDDKNNASINAGTMVQGELQSSIDVNKSKIGDRVIVKTTKAVKQGGKTVVAKGTQLVGRVTDIAKRTKEIAQSRIGVLFDRIEGANLSQPISLTIVSITKAQANAGFDDDMGAFSTEGINTSTVNASDASRPAARGGIVRSTTGATGGVIATVANTSRAAVDSAGNTLGTATQTTESTVRNTGSAVRNIDLGTSASGSASTSTTLSSNDKNFKIEKGATFNMRVDK